MLSNWSDWFSLKRRQAPRVAVNCLVDMEVPETEPLHYTGLTVVDVSTQGIRLEGGDVDHIRGLTCERGRAWMKLRLPGIRSNLPRVEAELRGSLGAKPQYQTGWRFSSIDGSTIKLISEYVVEHSEDILEELGE